MIWMFFIILLLSVWDPGRQAWCQGVQLTWIFFFSWLGFLPLFEWIAADRRVKGACSKVTCSKLGRIWTSDSRQLCEELHTRTHDLSATAYPLMEEKFALPNPRPGAYLLFLWREAAWCSSTPPGHDASMSQRTSPGPTQPKAIIQLFTPTVLSLCKYTTFQIIKRTCS